MTSDTTPPAYARRVPTALAVLAVGIVVLQVGLQLAFEGPAALLGWSGQLSVVLTAMFAVPVLVGGGWLRRSSLAPSRYPRVGAWVLVVLVAILALNLLMITAWSTGSTLQDTARAVQAAAMGAAGGILFGSIEARAIHRAVVAERAHVRAERSENQREWLEYLNNLLRHEVLNTANVIVGYTDLLLTDFEGDEDDRHRLERIGRQSRKMTDVIQDVRLLLQTAGQQAEFEPVDVVDVLQAELLALEDKHPDVAVEASWPDRAFVSADDLLARVFSNLLSNAVEHNDRSDPSVGITVEATPDEVRVSIADNGPGVSAHVRETLFDQSHRGDHGLGLYLVQRLVERYDGSVTLAATGPDGSTFVVELPRAEPEPPTAGEAAAVMVDAV